MRLGGQPPDILIAGRARTTSGAGSGRSGRRMEKSVGGSARVTGTVNNRLPV